MEDNLLQQISKPALVVTIIVFAIILWKISVSAFSKITSLLEGIMISVKDLTTRLAVNDSEHHSIIGTISNGFKKIDELHGKVENHETRITVIEKFKWEGFK